MAKIDGPEKYLPEERNSTVSNPDKYLLTGEIADKIAEIVGMETFSSGRYNSDTRANFTWEERRKIYEYITGEDGREYSRIELNYLIMDKLDSNLHASYDYEFVRQDLKIILEYVKNHEPETKDCE
jgi:hypothetical protein